MTIYRNCCYFFQQSLLQRLCPICRSNFHDTRIIPDPRSNQIEWFRAIDTDCSESLSRQEVVDGLKAVVALDWKRIEVDTEKLWSLWDTDGSGSISLSEFQHGGLLLYLLENYPRSVVSDNPPDLRRSSRLWFEYFDEDGSGELDKGEVVRAIIKTLRLQPMDASAIRETLDCIWQLFDTDNSGCISKDEFTAREGLADTILATLMNLS